MKTQVYEKTYYINEKSKSAKKDLSNILLKLIIETQEEKRLHQDLVILCIGSDRVTGDSLGPMVGYQLIKNKLPGIWIYGTLEHPVHALNLEETAELIQQEHPRALVVALDASLGSRKHQEYITLGKGCLYPGAGVKKNLVPVGDIYITGIINLSGAFEYLALQTTRLATVMRMADCITSGILLTCQKYYLKRAYNSNPGLFRGLDQRLYEDMEEVLSFPSPANTISLQECAVGETSEPQRDEK